MTVGKHRRHTIYDNLAALRWDVAIAVLALVGGVVGALGIVPPTDPLSDLIGRAQKIFDVVYAIAGGAILIGIGGTIRWLHIAGVRLFGTSIAVRLVVLVGYADVLGLRRVLVTATFYVAVLWAAWQTDRALRRGDTTAVLRGDE